MKKTTKSHCFQVPTDVLSQAKIIGKQLKIARKKRSLTQADVAMRIGVTRDVVIKAEQGISVASHSLLSMVWMVGLLSQFAGSIADSKDVVGLSLSRSKLPKRVRVKNDEFQ
jgi:transcriptional regulator with XRE-family HTH domain